MRLKRTATFAEVDNAIREIGQDDRFIQSLNYRHDYILVVLTPFIILYSYFLIRKVCKQYHWGTMDYIKKSDILRRHQDSQYD